MAGVTPPPLTSSPDPFVSLERNPALDEATLSLSKIQSIKVTSEPENCFLCGDGILTSVTLPRRHSYLKMVQYFKGYLTQRKTVDGVETCAICRQEIQQVWDLHQEIEAIKENIAHIVERVTGGETTAKKVLKGGRGPKSRRQTKSKGTSNSRSSATPQNSKSNQFHDGPASDPDFDPFCVQVKPELSWSVDEDEDNGTISDSGSCFEMLSVTQEVKLESDIPSGLSPNYSRPKRKSRLMAEKILRRTVASERNQDEISDDDEHYQDQREDPEESVSDPESGQVSNKKSSTSSKPCPHCKKLFKLPKYLQHHIRTVHLKTHSFSCNHCPKTFPNSTMRNQHISWNHTHATFPCSSCSKELATQKRWAVHEATVCKVEGWTPEKLLTEFNVTLLPCPEEGCGKLFDRPSDVKKHLISHTGLKPFSCPTCEKSFTQKSTLSRHICPKRRDSEDTIPPKSSTFSCSSCSRELSSHKAWAIHEATICKVAGWTEERLREFKVTIHPCSVEGCGKSFGKFSKLTSHLASHLGHGHSPPKVLCDLCGLSLDPSKLSAHTKRVHEKIFTKSCAHCDRRFFTSTDLTRHIATVHEGKKQPSTSKPGQRHICEKCGAQYRWSSNLYQHMVRVHGDLSRVRYECEKCPAKFYTKTELRRHQNLHSKYGWCCGDCGRNFESDRKLEEHHESLGGVLCSPVAKRRRKRVEELEISEVSKAVFNLV